jgi:hypothetical protein
MLADLLQTIVRQWLHSGWPWIVALAMTGPLAAASVLASVWHPPVFAPPTDTPDAELIGLVLLVAVVFVVIATTIIVTLWFAPRMSSRSRR